MADVTYDVFARWLKRSNEIASETDMNPLVVLVYNEVLKPFADSYLALDDAVIKAVSAWAKENAEAVAAIDALEEPFKTARATVLAYVPTLSVPETLSAQKTDTDKITAIERLIDTVDDHIGTPWADAILAGELGTKGPETVREINESTDANKGVSATRQKRAEAFGPTWERFLRFKRVVRSALGPASKQYRRIHGRSSEKPEPNEGGGGGGPTA